MKKLVCSVVFLSQFFVASFGYSWFWHDSSPIEWSKSKAMTSPDSYCKSPDVSLSNTGQATAVWLQWEETQNVVHGTVKTQHGWNESKCISLSDGHHFHPQLDSNEQGTSIAIWINKKEDVYTIESALYDGIWMPTVVLSTSKDLSLHPKICINELGDGVATWSESSQDEFLIKASVFSMNQWSEPQVLSRSKKIGLFPSIDFNVKGEALVAWHSMEDAKSVIEAVVYQNGSWSTPIVLSPSKVYASEPRVSLNESGSGTVVWVGREIGPTFVQGADYTSGKWTFFGDLSERDNQNVSPSIAMNNSRKKIVIWEHSDRNNHRHIYARVFNGNNWQPAATLSELAQNARTSKLCMSKSGNAIVLWQDRSQRNEPLFISKLNGETWSSPKRVPPLKNALHSSEPNLSMNQNGEITIIRAASGTDPLVIGTIDLQEGTLE